LPSTSPQAVEDLGVLCVAADPAVERHSVFEAAYELARACRSDTLGLRRRSLFDLPLGKGPSWLITDREVPSHKPDARFEEIEYTVLPAWRSEGELDLTASPLFGARPALDALRTHRAEWNGRRGRRGAVSGRLVHSERFLRPLRFRA
jgi:hypothetical protein